MVMDRTSKSRVLTAYDVMTAHDRACERIRTEMSLGNTASCAFAYAEYVVGVELMTRELLALLTEDEENG